jgi:CxxC motif-containing protein (DUF1111 family)
LINGGTFAVPPGLGDKIIHLFGDFLLHDIGSGDGDRAGSGASPPAPDGAALGVRPRSRLMHDGQSLTFGDAIQRHAGEGGRREAGIPSAQRCRQATFVPVSRIAIET